MKLPPEKILLAALAGGIVGMSAYVLVVYRQTSKIEHAPAMLATSKDVPPPEPDRAFVKIEEPPKSAKRGGTWSLYATTHTWAKCAVDLYRPDGQVAQFATPADASAVLQSPGIFRWTWNIPQTAQTGTWTVRMLCGTFENLASTDVAVIVE